LPPEEQDREKLLVSLSSIFTFTAMLLRLIGAALLTAGVAHGFKNSSPFLMLSTYP
jgi:hypothetical protein